MNSEMMLLTTENLPVENIQIDEVFSMIQTTYSWKISKKGFIESIMDKKTNEYQTAIDNFMASAPRQANAIIGVKVSTCTLSANNGAFMYLTHIGTPVTISRKTIS